MIELGRRMNFGTGIAVAIPVSKSEPDPIPEGDEDDIIEYDDLIARLACLEQENYELRLENEELKEELRPFKMQKIFGEVSDAMVKNHMNDAMKQFKEPLKFFKTESEINAERQQAIKFKRY